MISKPSSLPTAISLLASLCFLASCDGPKTESVNYDDLGWKKNVYYFKKQPFTGSAVQTHSNGALKGHWEFKAGLPHGKIIEFDEHGTKIAETQYKDGQRHGKNTYWDKNGVQIKSQIFHMGKVLSVEHTGSLGGSKQHLQ